MDKNAIKKYAVWARRELIERVSQRAMIYGITAKDAGDPNAESVNGHLLSQAEKRQRQALIRNIKTKGYEQVMEEVAYTWFNRFAALRFMEVNGYLPSHIRVFTNDAGEFKPQILAEAIHLELDGLDMNKVYELESANKSEELFKYLLIVQCNALNSILPGMFQRIEDYTELLLPDYLLREGSVIEQMVTTIPEEDWTDQVQIIGWLYQYYNTEPKDKVFADLKKNIKITKENIPAATQLFTPDWIVHYMVENSLGRLWLEGHPNDALKSEWKYYLDEAEQEPEVQVQLAAIRKEYAALKPEEIRVIDPCQGSGHILCVLFDVLVRIYEDYGYTAREAAGKIVENNLWGLDIDDRATQLAYFSVMMKARQYDRRFFNRGIQPHVYAFEDSNGITTAPLHDMGISLSQEEYSKAAKQIVTLVEEFHDAKEYGSIINVSDADWDLLRRFAVPRWETEGGQIPLNIHGEVEAAPRLQALINLGQTLAQKYYVIVTNPPYMGGNGMSSKLTDFVKECYPETKYDLFSCCIEKFLSSVKKHGFVSMITMESWMFLSSFEKMRARIFDNDTIINMVHMPYLGKGGTSLGINFGTSAVVFAEGSIRRYSAQYDYVRYYETDEDGIPLEFPVKNERYNTATIESFKRIPSSPVAYWASTGILEAFKNGQKLKTVGDTRQGMATSDNNRFLRLWFEVDGDRIGFSCKNASEALESRKKWFPYNKGGAYRKWYGNCDYVINYENDGQEVKGYAASLYKSATRTIKSISEYFKPCLSWSKVTTVDSAFRYFPEGFIFDVAGCCIFYTDKKEMLYHFGFLNSKICKIILSIISPTMNYEAGHIASMPIVYSEEFQDRIVQLVEENIHLAQIDWDSFENSWAFKKHPMIRKTRSIRQAYEEWSTECDKRFSSVKSNEEEINRLFISIYNLGDEVSPDVDEENITIRHADLHRDIISFISYAIGCMFGRFSLDIDGVVCAGGQLDSNNYLTFLPDTDAILPISDDEYFEDDIVNRFVKFVEIVYGKEMLEENLRFIADALGGNGSSREIIRRYFINDFYVNHCSDYSVAGSGKRPIYWLFDSGKKNGFKCLIYMHRYQPDTIARIRTDYVHEQQARYRTAIADLENQINSASTSERVKLTKRLQALQAQAEEIRVYEEKIHHLADQMIKIDLDDGVKHNYEIFKDVLAKIK